MTTVTDLSVDEGTSVLLNCTCIFREQEVTWRGPKRISSHTEKAENETIPYTEHGESDLNPRLNSTNINVFSNYASKECILEIKNFSRLDEGTYKCENLKLKVLVFKVFIKSK